MISILLAAGPDFRSGTRDEHRERSLVVVGWDPRCLCAQHRACSKSKEVGSVGVAEPSEADVTATPQLQVALNTVDIRVLSEQDVVSLSERRLIG